MHLGFYIFSFKSSWMADRSSVWIQSSANINGVSYLIVISRVTFITARDGQYPHLYFTDRDFAVAEQFTTYFTINFCFFCWNMEQINQLYNEIWKSLLSNIPAVTQYMIPSIVADCTKLVCLQYSSSIFLFCNYI